MKLEVKKKKPLPKYFDGGKMNEQMPGLGSAVGSVGTLFDKLSPQKFNTKFSGDQQYQKDIQKARKPAMIANGVADAAIATGNPYAMAGGLAIKGGMALGRAMGIGQGKVKRAEDEALMRATNQSVMDNTLAGNMSRIPAATAPLYGRKGGKLTRMSKYC